MKRIIILFIAILMILSGSFILANGYIIDTTVTTEANSVVVSELQQVNTTDENVTFWIQSEATDINISFNGQYLEYEKIGDNTYSVNMSGLDFSMYTPFTLTYSLVRDINKFRKTLMYNTSSLYIEFDGTNIFGGGDYPAGSFFVIELQGETIKTKTETNTEYILPDWIYIAFAVLIVIILLSFIIPSKKHKTTKKKVTSVGSEELLNTKKALLMEVLKDIEKQHRAKQISDDTYHKLKDYYKQEAVDAMKKLDDMK